MLQSKEDYVILSLELHLFFARIMKEHSLFLETGFTPPNVEFAKKADFYKNEFEKLLSCAVSLGNGIVGENVLNSGEIVTEFTDLAEKQTQKFTGIQINGDITRRELRMTGGKNPCVSDELVCSVRRLNKNAVVLLSGLIELKESILKNVLGCQMFTVNYPLLIEHILREAKLYRMYTVSLEDGNGFNCQTMEQVERFWNQIMLEHALFIRGLLDPTENDLINASNEFAEDYARLLAKSGEMNDRTITLNETVKLRNFKAAGAKGIQNCKIRSIILPLLADHVLREANHYIRLLSD